MQIRHLKIERFRGIKLLDWQPAGAFVCLVGPGDSTKSTIIEAIELTLSPRWDYAFDDSDFFDGNTDSPIIITATVGQLPDGLRSDDKFGLHIRGWSRTGLRDEPEEDDEEVLSVRLKVDLSLEPEWTVITDRRPEGRVISSRDRQLFGVLRLSSYVDRHLTWNPGTVLFRLTDSMASLRGILAEAGRAARAAITRDAVPTLAAAADRAQELARDHGVAPRREYRPGLDIRRVNIGQGGIALHDGEVPLRRAGLGTRRLVTFALQREAARRGGITLVDEPEHGLEPHRMRSLLRVLRPAEGHGQVVMTTHSPIALEELEAPNLRIVRSKDGETCLVAVPASLQAVIRASSEALLGRKIIVCEGKTEVGTCRALDDFWSKSQGKDAFAYLGVVPVEGGGTDAPRRAIDLRALGYPVCFIGDSDRDLVPSPEEMAAAGICVLLWADGKSIEERVAFDLPWEGVLDVLELAVEERGEQSVRDSVISRVDRNGGLAGRAFREWQESQPLRQAIGLAAKNGSWFKRIDSGQRLGEIIYRYLDQIPATDLAQKPLALRQWIERSE
jgi:putative ATP-dependent endonuclease of the OLD family